ncbi:MAG: Glu/Leu/Phe/Val dehydrogenase dimerization domain-containing protein [Steroidobacteraceae bacterium]
MASPYSYLLRLEPMNLWTSAEFDGHEQVCLFSDPGSGLRAIVAIHSTALGAAAGGTRFRAYLDEDQAFDDALRLSRAMSYKCALAGLPCGGGKAVIIGDPERLKSERLLHAYGRFLNRIGSSFVTGEDVGMSVRDIETVREVSPYVGGTSTAGAGDPSVHTAAGLMHGLRAVLARQFPGATFADVHVAVQGLGAVGWGVAERLHEEGAGLTVADIEPRRVERAVAKFGARQGEPGNIHRCEADIFCPCALGGVITVQTAQEIRARAVAGAANNQLASAAAGVALAERGILYAPDFVINAGGIISALEEYFRMPGREGRVDAPLPTRLAGIHDRLAEIFERAALQHQTPEATAERWARELIGR